MYSSGMMSFTCLVPKLRLYGLGTCMGVNSKTPDINSTEEVYTAREKKQEKCVTCVVLVGEIVLQGENQL